MLDAHAPLAEYLHLFLKTEEGGLNDLNELTRLADAASKR
jgi:hypothetical protein